MGLPESAEARVFYRCGLRRLEDAEVLLGAGKTTGAVYLAGYAVECLLKALILDALGTRARRTAAIKGFRGTLAHSYEWLRREYVLAGGGRATRQASENFRRVAGWSPALRYEVKQVRTAEADLFFAAVRELIAWADGRF